MLSSLLQQLQAGRGGSAGGPDGEERLLASLRATAAGGSGGGSGGMAVEELVDSILMEVREGWQVRGMAMACSVALHGCLADGRLCCMHPFVGRLCGLLSDCSANLPSPMQVHRRDCEISSLGPRWQHLEASAAGSARHAAEAEVRRGGGRGRGAAAAHLCRLIVRDRALAPQIALC